MLGGILKLDFNYAINIAFGGEERRVYRESRFVKMIMEDVSSSNSPNYYHEKFFYCFTLEVHEDIVEVIVVSYKQFSKQK